MHARNLALALSLVVGGVIGCAGSKTADPQVPTQTSPPVQTQAQASDPPPAIPPTLAQPQLQTTEVAGVAGGNADLAPTPGPAPMAKDEDELAKIGPNQAQLEADARANAQAQAKDKAKWAKAAHDADRKGTEEWSRDHVQKASARASLLQSQSSRVPPAKRGKFNTDMTTFQTRKAEVLSRINSLTATGGEVWKTTKAELDAKIDEMDQALIRVEGDF